MAIVSPDSPSCEVPCLILHSVVYRDVTRKAKGLYRLKHVGALKSGLAYLSWCNSVWFCDSLPHVKFAYNRSMHSTTKMYPFEIIYGLLPHAPIDLMPLPNSEKLNLDAKQRAELMLKLHETTKENIERMNSKYKLAGDKGRKQLIFEPGELVWLHLRKDRFSILRKSKLMPRADGPFKVLERINDNAYKLDLPVDFRVSPTFNIADLKPYLGEDDEDIITNDTSTPTPATTSPTPLGPITCTHARQLTHQVSLLLSSGSSYLDNRDTCTLILLRNNGVDQKGRGIAQAGVRLKDRHDL
jgi:hypothetical protein